MELARIWVCVAAQRERKARGGSDAGTSLTTSNSAIALGRCAKPGTWTRTGSWRIISKPVGRIPAAGKNTKNLNTVIDQPCPKENNRSDRFAPHPAHSASYQLIGRLHWGQCQRSSSFLTHS